MLRAELERLGASRLGPLAIGGHAYRFAGGLELDVLESSAPWVSAALDHPAITSLGWPVIDLSYLVLMKLEAGRDRDLRDVVLLTGQLTDQQFGGLQHTVARFLPDAADDLLSLRHLSLLEARRAVRPAPGTRATSAQQEDSRCD